MYNVSLSLVLNAVYRDGSPAAPGSYTLVWEREALSDEHMAVLVRDALSIAAARFDCTADVVPDWVADPDGEPHRITWWLDSLGGALILASAPQVPSA